MKKLSRTVLALLPLQIALGGALAAQSGTLSVSGNPSTLTITSAVAGFAPDPVSDNTTTYALLDVTSVARVTARLDAPIPTGSVLRLTMEAPGGAVSSGPVELSTTDQVMVRLIPVGSHSGLTLTYQFVAASAAGVVPPSVRTVTFTVSSDL